MSVFLYIIIPGSHLVTTVSESQISDADLVSILVTHCVCAYQRYSFINTERYEAINEMETTSLCVVLLNKINYIVLALAFKATPSHTLVSGHSQAYKWMRAGG